MGRWVLLLVVVAACSRPREIVVTNEIDSSSPVEIFINEHRKGTYSGKVIRFSTTQWGKCPPRMKACKKACVLPPCRGSNSDSLIARVKTACGTLDYCVRFLEEDKDLVPPPGAVEGGGLQGVLLGRKRPGLDVCTAEYHDVWVDNRGGPQRKLVIGAGLTRTVPAGGTLHFQAPAAACAAQARVELDGREIGALPVVEDGLDYRAYQEVGSGAVFIDAGGGRCYEVTSFSYAPGGGFGGGPSSEVLVGAQVYRTRYGVTDFLKQAPRSIETYTGHGSRTQLLEIPCPAR